MGLQRNAGKEVVELFPATARTATASTTAAIRSAQGLFYIEVSAASGSPSVTFTIYGVSPRTSTDSSILASAAITGTGTTILRVSPHLTAAANTIAKDILPAAIKVTATHGTADSITYSVHFVGMDA